MTQQRADADLEAVHLQPMEVLDGPILLAPYDPQWPLLYEREEARIRATLRERAIVLEHAGSTSVPGLSAKPKIDIVLGVADTTDEDDYVLPLESAGYVLRIREPDWHQHRLLKGPDTEINLHVFTVGCVEIDRMLRFRDHVRTNADDRALYQQAKVDLARRQWKYTQHYADAKSSVVEDIIARAGVTATECVHY
jgi:GrpB-like predicted nucleotidyltransferase (UPF0157 family)